MKLEQHPESCNACLEHLLLVVKETATRGVL